MSVTVNTGAVAPPGAAGTQGANPQGSNTNVHIFTGAQGHQPTPHGHPEPHGQGSVLKAVGNVILGFLVIVGSIAVGFLLWMLLAWLLSLADNSFQPSQASAPVISAPAPASAPEVEPDHPAPTLLDPVVAPPAVRVVPVHNGQQVVCEVALSASEKFLSQDEAVMSFVFTNKDSLCTSTTGSVQWEGEAVSWEWR